MARTNRNNDVVTAFEALQDAAHDYTTALKAHQQENPNDEGAYGAVVLATIPSSHPNIKNGEHEGANETLVCIAGSSDVLLQLIEGAKEHDDHIKALFDGDIASLVKGDGDLSSKLDAMDNDDKFQDFLKKTGLDKIYNAAKDGYNRVKNQKQQDTDTSSNDAGTDNKQ